MSGQKWQLLEDSKPLSDFFVATLYIFKENLVLLESPFDTELNGLCSNSAY